MSSEFQITSNIVPVPQPSVTLIPSPTPTPETKTYHLVVNANQSTPGLDTGINLISGNKITITAQGYAAYSSGNDPADGCSTMTDPNGLRPNNGNPCPPI